MVCALRCADLWVISAFISRQERKGVKRGRASLPLWDVKGASAHPLVRTLMAPAVIAFRLFLTEFGQNSWQMIKLQVAVGSGSSYALLRRTARVWGRPGFLWAH